jgi:hypothetical protein
MHVAVSSEHAATSLLPDSSSGLQTECFDTTVRLTLH